MRIITADEYFHNLPSIIKKEWLPSRVANLGWNFSEEKQEDKWNLVQGEEPEIWK